MIDVGLEGAGIDHDARNVWNGVLEAGKRQGKNSPLVSPEMHSLANSLILLESIPDF